MIARYDVIIIADMIAMIIAFCHTHARTSSSSVPAPMRLPCCAKIALLSPTHTALVYTKSDLVLQYDSAFGGCVTGPGSGASII